MDQNKPIYFELGACCRADLPHFGKRHGFIGFIVEIKRAAVGEVAAYYAFKQHHSAVRGGFQSSDHFSCTNRVVSQSKQIRLSPQALRLNRLTTADGRKESHFVTVMEHR